MKVRVFWCRFIISADVIKYIIQYNIIMIGIIIIITNNIRLTIIKDNKSYGCSSYLRAR